MFLKSFHSLDIEILYTCIFLLTNEIVHIYIAILCVTVWVVNRLHSGSTDIVIKTVLTFRDSVPPSECLRVMSLLLICDNMEVRNAVGETQLSHVSYDI